MLLLFPPLSFENIENKIISKDNNNNMQNNFGRKGKFCEDAKNTFFLFYPTYACFRLDLLNVAPLNIDKQIENVKCIEVNERKKVRRYQQLKRGPKRLLERGQCEMGESKTKRGRKKHETA